MRHILSPLQLLATALVASMPTPGLANNGNGSGNGPNKSEIGHDCTEGMKCQGNGHTSHGNGNGYGHNHTD